MNLNSANDWHRRFSQQARWTNDIRAYLFQHLKIHTGQSVLDVGSGTGVIFEELDSWGLRQFGIDIDISYLKLATHHTHSSYFSQGDAHQLPYPADAFDVAMCHFLLMWVEDPKVVLDEMTRVTKPDGSVLALAEPDYGGRIDYPSELAILGEWQTESLRFQGADPLMGRQMVGLFKGAGLKSVETGVLGGQWSGKPDWDSWRSEWRVMESDMAKAPEGFQTSTISELRDLDKSAYRRGTRVLFVPTFYARGIVP